MHASFPVKGLLEVFRVAQGFVVKGKVVQGRRLRSMWGWLVGQPGRMKRFATR